jgi:hypothetical protein
VSFYREMLLPHLVHMSMRQETFDPYRGRVVSAASGRVLEIGVGSGLNLPFSPPGLPQGSHQLILNDRLTWSSARHQHSRSPRVEGTSRSGQS